MNRFCDLTTHPLVPMVCVRHSSAFLCESECAISHRHSRGIPMGLAAFAFAPTAFSDSHIPLTVARLNSDRPSKGLYRFRARVMPFTLPRRPTDLPIDHRLVYRQCHGLAACQPSRRWGSPLTRRAYLSGASRHPLSQPLSSGAELPTRFAFGFALTRTDFLFSLSSVFSF